MKKYQSFICLLMVALFSISCNTGDPKLSSKIPRVQYKRQPTIQTAFFGLDELPLVSVLFTWDSPGKDGMPVVFSHEIDPESLDAEDFEIVSKDGSTYDVDYATLRPASEEFELRTVLLIGELGEYPSNPPQTVRIVGDLITRTGQNYKGQTIEVMPLEDGPVLSYAEYFTFDENYPHKESGPGCDCPVEGTSMVVRTVWSGGVRALDGEAPGEEELNRFKILMLQDKDTVTVSPFAFGDLGDNDNNLDLCLSELGIPLEVQVEGNTTIDPRNDKNPPTIHEVIGRWDSFL
mgnify:CR=1 FL=1